MAQPNVRMLPPVLPAFGTPGINPITIGVTTYQCALGSTIDVPMAIVPMLQGNGWIPIGRSGQRGSIDPAHVGATTGRPATQDGGLPLAPGSQYLDTTLGKLVTYDGATWRDVDGTGV